MRIKDVTTLIFLLFAIKGSGQSPDNHIQGKVTFVTASNAYVKFDNTEKITVGDTLQLFQDSVLKSCLIVKDKSTVSCVCVILNGCKVNKEDKVIHPKLFQTSKEIAAKSAPGANARKGIGVPKTGEAAKSKNKEHITGRVSAAGYSTLSSTRGDNYRTMYRFSLDASRIRDSKFSFETYLNYRQNFLPKESSSTAKTNVLSVYNLAMRFDAAPDFSITLGRKINNNAPSLGAIDGMQAEKYFGNFFTGAIVGFRPDIYDYSFNSDLLEYGGYVGFKTNSKKLNSSSTLGMLEQKNDGATDRRYVFFQHSSTISSNLTFFSSFELDLYNNSTYQSANGRRLTNLFASLGYKISRNVNVYLSYDSRKRIMYYETYKTDIERLLEDDEARQGVRLRLNVKPIKNTSVGLSYSKRFQSSGENKSDNINGFITLNSIPVVQGLISVNYNLNTSDYLVSKVLTFRHTRSLVKRKLNADFYYRMIEYKYLSSLGSNDLNRIYTQNCYGTNLIYNINKSFTFSILGELNKLTEEDNYRINVNLIYRF